MVWIGGTIFIVIVLVPAVRQREFAGIAAPLVRWSGMRFRWVGWPCFGVLAATGIANLLLRGFGWQELQSAEFWQSSFGYTLMIKLSLVYRPARCRRMADKPGRGRNQASTLVGRAPRTLELAFRLGGDGVGDHARPRRAILGCRMR
ncbi:MAG: hypothetical protein ACXW5W_09285 [Candidatus Binatia bacterium]